MMFARRPDGCLACRAWVGIVLSHLQMKHTRCYDFVRLLHMVPSGLFHLEVDAILFQSDIILKLALDTYGLVYAIDKKGQRFKNFYEASKHPGGASYLLEDFAAHEIDASGVPMPSVSKVMLKLYLPVIDDQVTLPQSTALGGPGDLRCGVRCWGASRNWMMMTPPLRPD